MGSDLSNLAELISANEERLKSIAAGSEEEQRIYWLVKEALAHGEDREYASVEEFFAELKSQLRKP